MRATALAICALLTASGCGAPPRKVKRKRIDFNAPAKGYGPVKKPDTPEERLAKSNGKADQVLREAAGMMQKLRYKRARQELSRITDLDCSHQFKDRARAARKRAGTFLELVGRFPKKGSARQRIGKFETVDRQRDIEAEVLDEDDVSYKLRLGKSATATLRKDALRRVHILDNDELDARYTIKLKEIRDEASGDAGALVGAARFAFTHGLLDQVHKLLETAYRIDSDLELLTIE